MLSLDSPRWQSLSHAYGDAADAPAMLRELAHDMDEAWEFLWSALYHQGSSYTATYAAVPHVVDLAARVPAADRTRARCLAFVGAVALSGGAAPLPEDLRADYIAAQQSARPLAIEALDAGAAPRSTVTSLLVTLAALDGDRDLASILEGFIDDELHLRCPGCRVDLVGTIDGNTLRIAREDEAGEPVGLRTIISPALHPRAGIHPALASALALVEGTATCPACHTRFVVRGALRDA